MARPRNPYFDFMALDFHDRLREAREARGLTQDELAYRAGLSGKALLSAWELGRNVPRLDHVTRVAAVLRVSVDWLAGMSDEGGPED